MTMKVGMYKCMCMAMSPTHHKHNMFVNDNEYIASGNNKLNVPVSIIPIGSGHEGLFT